MALRMAAFLDGRIASLSSLVVASHGGIDGLLYFRAPSCQYLKLCRAPLSSLALCMPKGSIVVILL
jgi:hypothetical protein